MSEAVGGGTPDEVRLRLIQRSMEDEEFRQRLLEAPKTAIEEELGARLPEEVQIRAIEETPETVYLVLPATASTAQQGGELSDQELEAVAGGWATPDDITQGRPSTGGLYTCNPSFGACTQPQ